MDRASAVGTDFATGRIMSISERPKLKDVVDAVAREIAAAEHRAGGSYVRTPLLYPGGANVVVRIEQGDGRFFVSDIGLGHQEAELMGAGSMYAKPARIIAEE